MASIIRTDSLQNLNTSNIITQTNATTLTIGASGQTISIPAGATLTNNGTASGFGLTWQSVQTTGFTAVKGNAYPCNTTSAGFTVTLPATPSAGDQVQVVDYAGTFDTNFLIINPNSNKIEGGTSNLQLSGEREGVILTYIDSTQGWIATSGINEGTDALGPVTFLADILVIAGGGAGGSAYAGPATGGGGAGGFQKLTSQTITYGSSITVTVGAGGAGTNSGNGSRGNKGSNSVFGTNTSIGGGGGGGFGRLANGTEDIEGYRGEAGGSSGGSCYNGAIVATAGSSTAGQGNTGGSTTSSTGNSGGCGGGGANASASNVTGSGQNGTAGGAGKADSITGSSITYAGGGGGSSYYGASGSQGAGGSGGGGAGASNYSGSGVNGTVNLGGGGGGSAESGTSPPATAGANGGSGIVIVKYPDTFTVSNSGGGLTFSTASAGGFKVTSFTAGTGNISFS
jgi:hypothetical protein